MGQEIIVKLYETIYRLQIWMSDQLAVAILDGARPKDWVESKIE